MKKETFIILHNIRSAYNVGSIFRTADAAGVRKIFLTGYTPAPVDKFGKINSQIQKTALGAEKTIEWEKKKDIGKLIAKLKGDKSPYGEQFSVVAVEQSPNSINYKKFKLARSQVGPKYPLALIFGNEITGLSSKILQKCDVVIEIPMAGKKESLNVAITAGIVLFDLR
ncbi:MAG: TrmH family RNA methyltransferase [bacterium]|nr:TrmH family RNA methyltransferase [bacterium]